MRNSISLSILALVVAAPAFAGGAAEPVIEPAPVVAEIPPPPSTAWTGGYVGANISWGNATVDAASDFADYLTEEGLSTTLSEPSGTVGAIRGGYDWQSNNVVFGVGAEYTFGKFDGGATSDFAELAGLEGFDNLNVQIDQMATIFGRLGFAANDKFMAYGLLGYSWANGQVSADGGETQSRNLDGMTIGLGGEYKFNDNWSGYGEYAYTDFGQIEDVYDGAIESDINVIKLGVNYRF